MKNQTEHMKLENFHIVKILLFYLSKRVEKKSISKKYLGLCAYINGSSSFVIEKAGRFPTTMTAFL